MLRRLLLPAVLAGLLLPASVAFAEAGPIQTTITSQKPWAPDSTPTFTFKADRPNAEFTCTIDWSTFPCGYGLNANEVITYTSNVLGHGNHTFKVSACWEDDNIGDSACDPTPAVMDFELDLEGPETTFLDGSTPDNARMQGKPRYKLDGADYFAGYYKCYLDGVQIQGCDDWDQQFENVNISEGRHEFTVHGTDSYGNFGPLAKRVFHRDNTAPDVQFTSPVWTNDTTPELTFTAPEDGGPQYTADCKLDGLAVPCAWGSYTVPNTLSEGGHTFAVWARDAAGNVANWRYHEFKVDLTAPTIGDIGFSSASKTVTFATEGANTTDCSIDAAAFAACTSPYDVSALTTGDHTLKIRARDLAGNETTEQVTFDIPKPETKPDPQPQPQQQGGGATPPAGTTPAPVVTTPAPVVTSRASTTTTTAKKSTCASTKKAAKSKKKKSKSKKSKTKKAKASACKSAAKKKPAKKKKRKKAAKKK